MAEMTSRERLTCLFDGGVPDRMGSTFLINPYYTNSLPGKPDPVELMKELGADILDRDCPLPYEKKYSGGVTYEEVYKDGETRRIFTTPVGMVYESYAGKMAWGDIPFKKESYIKTPEDYKILQYVFEHTEFVPNYDWYEERDRSLGDHGIVVPQATEFRSSLEYLFEDNIERTIFDMEDYPEIVGEFLQTLREKNIEATKIAAESPAQVFNIWEDSSTTLLSPALFEEYVLPEFAEFTKIINGAGKKLIHHACGHIKDLLQMMETEQVAAFESLTPAGTGNIQMCDCAKAWGDKFLMIGGIDPAFLISCTNEELESYLENTIESMGDLSKKWIIENGDSMPPRVSLDKLRLIIEVAKRHTF